MSDAVSGTLAIVGSVSLHGNPVAQAVIEDVLARYRPSDVVSGGARGIDTMAAEAWKLRSGRDAIVFLPKVRRWEDGFKPRNLLIAQTCDALVRIVAKDSATYGSGWTRDRAAEMGKPTEEIVIDPVSGHTEYRGQKRGQKPEDDGELAGSDGNARDADDKP